MPHFSVRLDDDLAARFDTVAAGRGGRSRLLRRVIEAAAADAGDRVVVVGGGPTSAKLTLRLTESSRQLGEMKQVHARLASENDRLAAELDGLRKVAER
ncbi:MAG: hypothetical protein J0M36_07975, partial [Caulobacterales bacterium]|nr:hypothetical protein [Caulobacterales bacterium]